MLSPEEHIPQTGKIINDSQPREEQTQKEGGGKAEAWKEKTLDCPSSSEAWDAWVSFISTQKLRNTVRRTKVRIGFSKDPGKEEDDVRREIPGQQHHFKRPTFAARMIQTLGWNVGSRCRKCSIISMGPFSQLCFFSCPASFSSACSPLPDTKLMFNKNLWNKWGLEKGLGLSCLFHMSYNPRAIGRRGRPVVLNPGCMLKWPGELQTSLMPGSHVYRW